MKAPDLLATIANYHETTDLTVTALAREAGFDRQTVDRWLKGEVQSITVGELRRLCRPLERSLRTFVLSMDEPIQPEHLYAVLGAELPFEAEAIEPPLRRFVLKRTGGAHHPILTVPESRRDVLRASLSDVDGLAIKGSFRTVLVGFQPEGVELIVCGPRALLTVPEVASQTRHCIGLRPVMAYIGEHGGFSHSEYRMIQANAVPVENESPVSLYDSMDPSADPPGLCS